MPPQGNPPKVDLVVCKWAFKNVPTDHDKAPSNVMLQSKSLKTYERAFWDKHVIFGKLLPPPPWLKIINTD